MIKTEYVVFYTILKFNMIAKNLIFTEKSQ